MSSILTSILLLFIFPNIASFSAHLVLVLFATGGGAALILGVRRPKIPGPNSFSAARALSSTTAHQSLSAISSDLSSHSLISFSIGFTRFIVASRPETAKQILNSPAFADRPVKESARELLFDRAMGFAPFGAYWRNLRRISAANLFSPRSIEACGDQRREIGEWMVGEVGASMGTKGEVEVNEVLHSGALNNVMMSVFGKRYDFEKGEGIELEEMVREGYELLGSLNWGDHLPLFRWLDLQGVRRRSRVLAGKVQVFVGKIIEEHRIRRRKDDQIADFVDVLLDLNEMSHSDMVAVLWEMIFRGTDTIAILLEWILARMILHQDIQARAQAEIDAHIGNLWRPISSADISSLPYLQSIVKESLRMHPPGPLLSWARLSVEDTLIGNHLIPAGTTAMVNMWAIARDEEFWPESGKFKPERFMSDEVSIMGSDLRLAPFGSGRRACPGKAMGLATVHLWLAQLLQCFKWVPSDSKVDLSECLKMSMEMKNHLVCRVFVRNH